MGLVFGTLTPTSSDVKQFSKPPPPSLKLDRSSDDEGYQSADSDFDEPPPLIQDEYPTSHHSQLSHIHRDQPVLLSARLAAQARAGVSVNAASTADGTSDHEDADFFRPPARLFTKEPHSGGLGLPLPAHAPFIITVGGVRRRLCPCPVASHRWFHRVSGEMSGEIDREPRSDGERVERKWVNGHYFKRNNTSVLDESGRSPFFDVRGAKSAPDVAQLDAISHEEVQATRRARANACKNDLSSKLEWDDAVAISEWNETWEAVRDFYHLDRVIQVPCSDEILREYLRRYEESSGVLNERTLEMLPIWSSFKGTTPKIKLFQTLARNTKPEPLTQGAGRLGQAGTPDGPVEQDHGFPVTPVVKNLFSLCSSPLENVAVPPRRTRHDTGEASVHYEESPEDLTADRAVFSSADGRRLTQVAYNIGPKKRCIEPSDLADPYGDWDPLPEGDEGWTFLDEMVRCDGLGDAWVIRPAPPAVQRRQATPPYGVIPRLDAVSADFSQEWTGRFWNEVSLQSLAWCISWGMGVSLVRYRRIDALNGRHPHQWVAHDSLSLLYFAIHGIRHDYRSRNLRTFEALDLYRLLNLIVTSFGRMSVIRFLKRAKRAGRAHDPRDSARQERACAVLCWACRTTKLISRGWRDVSPEFIDANFRLKNRIRKNEHDDPSFGSGWGISLKTVRTGNTWRATSPKRCRTCIAFAALLQKDTRTTTGLRYANMDYIVVCAHRHRIAVVDGLIHIACQWQINLNARREKMPEHLEVPDDLQIQFGLPVWHAAAHEKSCEAQNSLTYSEGVGRTDGEGIERTWSALNPVAWATKEMGKGARHDALEDRIDHHNWEKNIGLGDTLARKLVVAIAERDVQIAGFREVDSTLKKSRRKEWQERIDKWLADRTQPNPYEIEGGRRMDGFRWSIRGFCRLALKKDELQETADAADGATMHCKGTTAFLVAGMQLEDLQHRIKAEAKGRTLLAADQSSHVQELRLSFERKLRTFQVLQARHMPAAVKELEDEEEARDPDCLPPAPEYVKLWMPSELSERQRERGCTKGLAGQEVKLREAQCSNAVDLLRTRLHAKRHMLLFRSQIVGQRGGSRSQTLVALVSLKGEAYCDGSGLRELAVADVTLDEEQEVDAAARQRLAKIGSKTRNHRNEPTLSSKKKKFSWIWTSDGGPEADEEGLHDSVRVEWSKAKARKDRWVEEVMLLREEMKRVMRFLRWKAIWWETQRSVRGTEIPQALQAGLDAYAARQAALHHGIARRFKADGTPRGRKCAGGAGAPLQVLPQPRQPIVIMQDGAQEHAQTPAIPPRKTVRAEPARPHSHAPTRPRDPAAQAGAPRIPQPAQRLPHTARCSPMHQPAAAIPLRKHRPPVIPPLKT
ncbi:hypothetical protein B0H13DRAFT_2469210, partial [Mycena leptocephala]